MAALLVFGFLVLLPSSALGQVAPLSLDPGRTFFVSGAESLVRLHGSVASPLPGVTAQVQVVGPGRPSSGTEDWPATADLTAAIGDLQGTVDSSIPLPASALPSPGAYQVRVLLLENGASIGSYTTWLAAVAPDQPQVDLAFVLPLMRGVHQDPSGAFRDRSIRDTSAPVPDSAGSLYSLVSLRDHFPSWRFTLAVEPVLLSQLDDQSYGFTEKEEGTTADYSADSPEAQQAAEALAVLRGFAREAGVQLIPTPYASPSLPVLAGRRWEDGTEQMRLGKAEFESLLEPAEIARGAYAPGLDLASDSLASFSQASIDYVVASAAVIRDLAEQPPDPLLPVRISDSRNNRVTLLPVSSELAVTLGPRWDVPGFFAAVASLLADGGRTALIASPADGYSLIEPADLQALGEGFAQAGFLSTVTLAELVQKHPSQTRPIFLSRFGGYVQGMISQVLLDEIGQAQQSVSDLVAAAGDRAQSVSAARLALFRAQSAYWFRPETGLEERNLGLAWAREASRLAGEQLKAVSIGRVRAVGSGDGVAEISVSAVSQATSSMSLLFEVLPEGGGDPVSSAGGTVSPGSSSVSFQSAAGGKGHFVLRVSAGTTQLALLPFEVTSGWLAEWWLWAFAAIVLFAVGTCAYLMLWRGRHRTPPGSGRKRAVQ